LIIKYGNSNLEVKDKKVMVLTLEMLAKHIKEIKFINNHKIIKNKIGLSKLFFLTTKKIKVYIKEIIRKILFSRKFAD